MVEIVSPSLATNRQDRPREVFQMTTFVNLPSQNLAQNRQYCDAVTCLPAHNEQRLVKVVKVQMISTRSGSIVILLPPTDHRDQETNKDAK